MNSYLRFAARAIFVAGSFIVGSNANAQMKVGDKPYSINKASVLELESDRQGLLLPRVQLGMLTAVPLNAAPDGMIVIVESLTKQDQVLYLRKNAAWVKLATLDESALNWNRAGNAVNDAIDFIGSTNAAAVIVKTNNAEAMRVASDGKVGIGNAAPTEKLDVTGNTKVSGSVTANSLDIANNVNLHNVAASTTLVEVLVIDQATGAVNRRTMSAAAFNTVVSTFNGSSAADQTLVAGSAGTDLNVATNTTTGEHIINIPTAGTGITRGLLSLADWEKLDASQKQIVAGVFSTTADAKGLSIGGTDQNEIILHAADATNPGGVSTATQAFGGDKNFAANVTVGTATTGNSTLNVEGSMATAIKSVNTSGYLLTDKDNTILANATASSLIINLPPAAVGRMYTIKKIGTGGIDKEVTVTPNGTALIEGGANFVIYNDWTFITIQSDGTNWYIIRK
ncbi:hypothetical protein GFS24_25855 [Chitinophaga sp. SYP-B3965]|uniref:hypothetical protein n=1 Tax=Chitinophaga sp. SYP-B3965 TaxID=2663120 RepID=UPI001299A4D4|nr:hypothetical protein [Chitinophaga sp. SYP-B3965]MRG48568.1 hypothetical protein [Chitinophaga sp. SYP-B3965]